MKSLNLKYVFGAMLLMGLFVFQGSLSAQNKGKKAARETKEIRTPEKQDEIKEKNETKKVKEVKKSKKDSLSLNENEGNAYGKNKGDLSGKEFGQERAAQAKLNKEDAAKLDRKMTEAEQKVKDSKEKIKASKQKLEKARKQKKISETEYYTRKEKIDKAEAAVKNLEKSVQKGKKVKKDK